MKVRTSYADLTGQFVIKSSEGYWNNSEGWTDLEEDATIFTVLEKHVFTFPIGKDVEWKELKKK